MTKVYKLEDRYNNRPALRYRWGDDGIDYSKRLVEPLPDGSDFLRTEQDIIEAWANLARDALVGEFRESDQRCWVGHYEQFGMVMLNLANMSRYRKNYLGQWERWFDGVMDDESYSFKFQEPCCTEDRIFYRCWFRLLGHPAYLQDTLTQSEVYTYKLSELCLYIAFDDFNQRLLSLKR